MRLEDGAITSLVVSAVARGAVPTQGPEGAPSAGDSAEAICRWVLAQRAARKLGLETAAPAQDVNCAVPSSARTLNSHGGAGRLAAWGALEAGLLRSAGLQGQVRTRGHVNRNATDTEALEGGRGGVVKESGQALYTQLRSMASRYGYFD